MRIDYQEKEAAYFEQSRPEMIPFVPDNIKSVLDVGCSTGNFGRLLKSKFPNCEVWGIEPHEPSANESSKVLDKVLNGTLEEQLSDIPDNYFDCIFFNDVLEHLVDPFQALISIRPKLKKTGSVIASIPNILNFENIYQIIKTQDWEYQDSGILDRTHLRFFTEKSIVRMFNQSGYKVDVIKGINPMAGRKFKIINFLLGKKVAGMRYIQFAIRANLNS